MLRFLPLLGLSAVTEAYCNTGPAYAADTNLGAVTLNGEGDSIHDTTDCPGVVGIRDLTSQSAALLAGSSYTLTSMSTTCGGAYGRMSYAYIDYDQSGEFDSNELLGQQQVAATLSPVSVQFTFTVPATAKAGATRMRVWVVENGVSPDPCLMYGYGGVKDFTINILDKPTASCCLPTTYSSVATVVEGTQVSTVYAYQDNAQQAYVERTEIVGKDFNALLCLGSTQICYSYTSSTCQKFSFIFPTQDCPGSNSSKFKYQGTSIFTPGGTQLSVYAQPSAGVVITTTTLGSWCVYNTWLPDSFYNSWDLSTPPSSVFAIPTVCNKVSAISPPPAKLFRR